MVPAYWFWHWLTRIIAATLFQFRVYGREKIPTKGPVLLASNHQSYLDPPLVGIATQRQVNFLARKTLMNNWFLKWLLPKLQIIPVDQDRPDMGALKSLIRILKNGGATAIFPEGSRSPDGALQPALPGIGLVIAKTLTTVVPMRIFNSVAAMTPGSAKINPVPITVVVGEPMRFTAADLEGAESKEALYKHLAERVMAEIAKLELPERRQTH